jgi:hypothetical protein
MIIILKFIFKIINQNFYIFKYRSSEIGAFAAQFRDSSFGVCSAGGGQRQQDGGPGG